MNVSNRSFQFVRFIFAMRDCVIFSSDFLLAFQMHDHAVTRNFQQILSVFRKSVRVCKSDLQI